MASDNSESPATLDDFVRRLAKRFETLKAERVASGSAFPIFALEHGLGSDDLVCLGTLLRAAILSQKTQDRHALAWIVYATELGYGFSGNEYWTTYEQKTPGWAAHGGGAREWVRQSFHAFRDQYGAAAPTGTWAKHFNIIAWPITHAVLSKDLQVQLARVLHDVRYRFSSDTLRSPEALGRLISQGSTHVSSRFRDLIESPLMIGALSSDLLLSGSQGSQLFLSPETVRRIRGDFDKQKLASALLKDAARAATERVHFKGLARPGLPVHPEAKDAVDQARTQAESLAIEPRLQLRPSLGEPDAWEVYLEVPDLTPLLEARPNLAPVLNGSRAVVAGAAGSPLARGRVLRGSELVRLKRWPSDEECLLSFEQKNAELEFLLRAECLRRPKRSWLFRIASDRVAYELQTSAVRPNEQYILVSRPGGPSGDREVFRPVGLRCEGVHAVQLRVPPAISERTSEKLRALDLQAARTLEVAPAGLTPATWCGEGRGEWLTTEQPCVSIWADHPAENVEVQLAAERLLVPRLEASTPIFVELPRLPAGRHRLTVAASAAGTAGAQRSGELILVVREPRRWAPDATRRSPFALIADPPTPSIEALLQGRAEVELRGPKARKVHVSAFLSEEEDTLRTATLKLSDLALPVSPEEFAKYLESEVVKRDELKRKLEIADTLALDFDAEELGRSALCCEREHKPLRWKVHIRQKRYSLSLRDYADEPGSLRLYSIPFESPDRLAPLPAAAANQAMDVDEGGGLYVALRGNVIAGVCVSPRDDSFENLRHAMPHVAPKTQSASAVADLLRLLWVWTAATPVGGTAPLRRRKVLKALESQLLGMVCGEKWAGVERSTTSFRQALNVAFKEPWRHRMFGELFDAATKLAPANPEQRVRPFLEIVGRHMSMPKPPPAATVRMNGFAVKRTMAQGNPEHPQYLAELALRVASDPASAPVWCGESMEDGLAKLLGMPNLAQAARLFARAVAPLAADFSPTSSQLLAGWGWR